MFETAVAVLRLRNGSRWQWMAVFGKALQLSGLARHAYDNRTRWQHSTEAILGPTRRSEPGAEAGGLPGETKDCNGRSDFVAPIGSRWQ